MAVDPIYTVEVDGVMIGSGYKETIALAGLPVHPSKVGVTVYVTLPGLAAFNNDKGCASGLLVPDEKPAMFVAANTT